MKHFKIENNLAQYSLDGSIWKNIDLISKEDVLALIDKATSEGFEMDSPEEGTIANGAHKIIYSSIYEKFSSLISERSDFLEESKLRYKHAFEKYSS
ncbi:hypothetical protein AB4516_07135 [Vibrio sp. 10N.222.54.F12]|uniref:Uncharacterized protein n=1 Tax=Vibrio qingdaonensis TaxID=2829491 RepID=A0A9X3CPW8_9VIBR|nr:MULTISPECIES: hypothetical protein [Vibrio]MCW8347236.1 hypothetical protein [Vibrio qingdaonensis]PML14079.1 hypothetical protein BCT83_17805 [Vibrio tasmaniensis]